MNLPTIIQGGMGVGVSSWNLARRVSQLGQLGVVSGALIAVVFARRLQLGDEDGHLRHAMAHFPFPDVAERILDEYFVDGGKAAEAPFKPCPMPTVDPGRRFLELTVAASFAEVYLAKENHDGKVGINLLEKIQLTTLPTLYGAMLAKVDAVLMGAGIPRSIPGILDLFASGKPADLRVDVAGDTAGEGTSTRFDPAVLGEQAPEALPRPSFLAIVSSSTLATSLARKSNGRVDGFVIEADTAGGHNAPPRGPMKLTEAGEPIYGPRDVADLAAFRSLGLPFWLAGSRASAEGLKDALSAGASGIQVGTAFAFCKESGMRSELRQEVLGSALEGAAKVFTDPLASPTGFPFKLVQQPGTLAEASLYESRTRVCDLGYLREAYRKEDGGLGYRCPAEPVDHFTRKGGAAAECTGRKCLCNGLCSTIGLPQKQSDGSLEADLITAGNDLANLRRFLPFGQSDYSAEDIIRTILEGRAAEAGPMV